MTLIIGGDVKRINERVHGMASGIMECPWCKGYLKNGAPYDRRKQTWKFDRWVTPKRARYTCGTCKNGVQYEM